MLKKEIKKQIWSLQEKLMKKLKTLKKQMYRFQILQMNLLPDLKQLLRVKN